MTETKSEKKQKKNKTNREVPLSFNIGYAIGEIPDMISYQGFSFLIFTFYSVVIGLPTSLISLVFIIWSIYNAFNDPLLGAISDRTKTKILGGGRRRPYIIAMVIPLSLIMFFLFTPPLGDDILTAAYMLLVMCIFDTVYTASSLNHTSLYPEMFPTDKAREEVGVNRRIFMVFGLLIAFVLPSVFVNEYVGNSEITILEYQTTGIVFGILIFITTLIHIKFGVKEPPLDEILSKESLSFKDSFKVTIKNRSFLIFIVS
ncbi:MAG: MFS transporter, partial [archaeon]|nr:MFS transporter [archaeon]